MPTPITETERSQAHSAAVSTTLASVFEIEFADSEWLSISITNSGATDLNAFAVKLASHPSATPYTLADSALEFADPTLIGCVTTSGTTGNPLSLAAGSSVHLVVPRHGAQVCELWASVASGSTTLSFYVGPLNYRNDRGMRVLAAF